MAGMETTGARHVVVPRPEEESATVGTVAEGVREEGLFVTLSQLDVSTSVLATTLIIFVVVVIAAFWFGHGSDLGTRRAFEEFVRSGRRVRVQGRQRADIDFRALRKSRPVVRHPDPTREIYSPPASPGSTDHPSRQGPHPERSYSGPQERPLST